MIGPAQSPKGRKITVSQPNNNPAMSCGEYLRRQRAELDRITDLGTDAARAEVKRLLANIYAVNYQMMYERIEPPGPNRRSATLEPVDRELVESTAKALNEGAPELQDIVDDPWKLSEAIYRARQGNGFQLVEMVNIAHLARTAQHRPEAPARTEPAARPAEPGL